MPWETVVWLATNGVVTARKDDAPAFKSHHRAWNLYPKQIRAAAGGETALIAPASRLAAVKQSPPYALRSRPKLRFGRANVAKHEILASGEEYG